MTPYLPTQTGLGTPESEAGNRVQSDIRCGMPRGLMGRSNGETEPKKQPRQHELLPIPLKSHRRRAKSLFRLGFDYLRSVFTNLDH